MSRDVEAILETSESTSGALEVGDLLLGRFELRHQLADPVGELVRLHLQGIGEAEHERPLLGQVTERLDTDERLHPADAGADRRLAGDGDQTDLRRVLHVRAATELARPGAAHLDDPDLLAVRLAEQRERADLPRGGQRHVVAR